MRIARFVVFILLSATLAAAQDFDILILSVANYKIGLISGSF